ncbi:MAG TPA: hypothetical protein VJO35_09595 [Terriglobales bacterium]|nr:hypothetical protein [Terriglobales bacterium]
MPTASRSPFLLTLILVAFLHSLGQGVPETKSGLGPRPVRDVILQWEKEYGWVITYEDPRLVYSGDVEDITKRVRRDVMPGESIDPSKRILSARERRISVAYTAPNSPSDKTAQLEAAKRLADASATDGGNTFVVSQSTTRLHVLPGLVRDSDGQLQPSQPLLSTVISLPAGDRDGIAFLHQMCDALTTATGYRVFVGTIPTNDMAQFHTKAGYEGLPAGQILEDFLDSMPDGNGYTWALLFQKDYALNIHRVGVGNHLRQPASGAPVNHRPRVEEMHSPDGTKTVYIHR